jgi:MOSC domain-containing protein YiiM
MARIDSVNIGSSEPNPFKDGITTGIGKQPVSGPVTVRDPGDKTTGLGSGLVGDHIGDLENHGGNDQAVYAFAREDLDSWEPHFGQAVRNGWFGENLTTVGVDVNEARLGEQWRIGADVVLQVTSPRIPCSTFRGRVGERGWLKTFTAAARPGAYLKVITPGEVAAGDSIEVVQRPDHPVTVALVFRALTLEAELLPTLLEAGDDLDAETRRHVEDRFGVAG